MILLVLICEFFCRRASDSWKKPAEKIAMNGLRIYVIEALAVPRTIPPLRSRKLLPQAPSPAMTLRHTRQPQTVTTSRKSIARKAPPKLRSDDADIALCDLTRNVNTTGRCSPEPRCD